MVCGNGLLCLLLFPHNAVVFSISDLSLFTWDLAGLSNSSLLFYKDPGMKDVLGVLS